MNISVPQPPHVSLQMASLLFALPFDSSRASPEVLQEEGKEMKKEANYPLGEDAKSDWYCELMIVSSQKGLEGHSLQHPGGEAGIRIINFCFHMCTIRGLWLEP